MHKKTIFERNIEESVKLRRRSIAEVEEEEKKHKKWIVYKILYWLSKPKWHVQKITWDRR